MKSSALNNSGPLIPYLQQETEEKKKKTLANFQHDAQRKEENLPGLFTNSPNLCSGVYSARIPLGVGCSQLRGFVLLLFAGNGSGVYSRLLILLTLPSFLFLHSPSIQTLVLVLVRRALASPPESAPLFAHQERLSTACFSAAHTSVLPCSSNEKFRNGEWDKPRVL